jgi:hypothetical protein
VNPDSRNDTRSGLGRLRQRLRRALAPRAAKRADAHSPELPPGTIGFVDQPEQEAVIGPHMTISGWALDPAGIRAIEVRLGDLRLQARMNIERLDVARVKPGYPNGERGGFDFVADFTPWPAPPEALRRRVEVIAISTDGRETVLGARSLIEPAALTRWAAAGVRGGTAFHVLPALSGLATHGSFGLETRYAPYLSDTTRVGMRVPILYLRTTRGRGEDFVFDPDFDVRRRSRGRAIADDNLSSALAGAAERKLPLLLTLNGGIWADASSSEPEWDANDWLETDIANCQWNEKNEVMPDDFLSHLPGSFDAPELSRSLSFNVYASEVRRYKKRNLQQAARHIASFMRAQPALLVGVSVDPDTYLNPFFDEAQWYDYNPGTLRQFRHWLAGSGPYAGEQEPGVPDLRAYRRHQPLDLEAVRALAGSDFARWEEVDAPRAFPRDAARPYWLDPWVREWEVFRRHLVALHYDDLARWLVEAGIPSERIWSAQGFMAPTEHVMPLALRIDSPVKDFDSGGVSIEGSKPTEGHLGAIVYGAAATNQIAMEGGGTLFDACATVDPGFAVVELNTADLRNPDALPSYADGYRAFRDLWNAGARFVSPMAWNGSSGKYVGKPGYTARTAWRDTPLEQAACDFLLARAGLPLESLLWTFGSPFHADSDGWSAAAGEISEGHGHLLLAPDASGRVVLQSRAGLPVRARGACAFVVGLTGVEGLHTLRILGRSGADEPWSVLAEEGQPFRAEGAGIRLGCVAARRGMRLDQLRLELALAAQLKLACVAVLLSG